MNPLTPFDNGWTPPNDTPCRADRNVEDHWFDVGITQRRQDTVAARRMCRPCPYTAECLAEALRYEAGKPRSERYGVWGGTLPIERARMAEGAVA